jgi:DNA-binding response OmpR family regulator
MTADDPPPLLLVVAHNRDTREVIQLALDEAGYQVLAVDNGGAALVLIEHASPDLILLDVSMPQFDGPGLCRAYREEGGSAPVVLISAGDADVIATTVAACGAAVGIAKPLNVNLVLDTITNLLGRP